ncbi:MAG: hypothetical protein EOO87_11145 [Pedobacter sp.]|nr:MAG: hypothetical protein EOO87_11145 [Pedobacter sp.]
MPQLIDDINSSKLIVSIRSFALKLIFNLPVLIVKSSAMNKIKLFAAPSVEVLQSEINEWLSNHADAHIIQTNMTSVKSVTSPVKSKSPDEYAFYILYVPSMQTEEVSVAQASRNMPSELINQNIPLIENN